MRETKRGMIADGAGPKRRIELLYSVRWIVAYHNCLKYWQSAKHYNRPAGFTSVEAFCRRVCAASLTILMDSHGQSHAWVCAEAILVLTEFTMSRAGGTS